MYILGTSVLAGIVTGTGFAIYSAASASPAAPFRVPITTHSSTTNMLTHFRWLQIRNCFFVQAEFFDLLFHFVCFYWLMNDLLLYAALLLILSTRVLAGIMTVTRFFSILGLWRTSPRMAWNSPIAAPYFNHLG